MTQMSRSADFGGGGDGAAERGGFLETEAVLGSGSSELRRDFDSGGLESLLNRLSKWMVAAVFGIVLLWKHDAEAMWAAMGSVLNSVLSVTLKQILNHERPAPALRSDPGMPSSHAQSISYAATFAFLSLVQWLGINAVTVTIGVFLLISASYMSYLRVSLKFHTVSQVLVGAALGSLCACVWFWSWRSFVLKAFISSIWVRLVVILGSASFCLAFLFYVVQHWLDDEP
ncbi:hypothetical protein QJS10_CPA01g01208 [Acorus calamus]|uniref:Phosphatidic acid phosphatase type 2/haloperoxidase domain-containing protein n=1 Tax=Acorus calamus TaxID=4465 RepID=A0AAV9FNP8_ACOCL|nr:hypothetical protein QJS10_CPA01g01208 [Acorus calamus]